MECNIKRLIIIILISLVLVGCKSNSELQLEKPIRISASYNQDINPKNFSIKSDADFEWQSINLMNARIINWLKIEFNTVSSDTLRLITPSSRFAYRVIIDNKVHHTFSGDFEKLYSKSYRSHPYIYKVKKNQNVVYIYLEEGFLHHTFSLEDLAIGTKENIKEYALELNRRKLMLDQIFYYQAITLLLFGILGVLVFIFVHRRNKSILFFSLMLFVAGLLHLRMSPFSVFLDHFRIHKVLTITTFFTVIFVFYLLFVNSFFKIKYKFINIIFFIIFWISSFISIHFNQRFFWGKIFLVVFNIIVLIQIIKSLIDNKSYDFATKLILFLGFFVHTMIISFDWLFGLIKYHRYLSPISIGLNAIAVSMIYFLIKHYKQQQLELQQSKIKVMELQKNNLLAELTSLKQQIDPHFLFNSLGALISLIDESKETAQIFVEQLSKVYRYILQVKDKDLIIIKKEIEFAKAYIFLLKYRFRENLMVDFNIDKQLNGQLIIPASIQMLLENCVKHNIISANEPLHIKITSDSEYITVENNLQPKTIINDSEKIGLENLKKRFSYYTNKQLIVEQNSDDFIVRIPIIKEVE